MVPVITIDGPSGVGKGTLSLQLADTLHWNFLDSGAIYRAFALYAVKCNVDLENEAGLYKLADLFPLHFKTDQSQVQVFLSDQNVSREIRQEETGRLASIVAKHPLVRTVLLERQRDFAVAPGLVADGRDMGTVVFPDAPLKIFLTATSEERAKRRYKQLLELNNYAKMDKILLEIKERDARDRNRSVSPLVPAHDALVIDTSNLTQEEVFQKVYQCVLQMKFLS